MSSIIPRSVLLLFVCFVAIQLNGQVSFSGNPAWLDQHHPDFARKPAASDISNGYFLDLLDLQTNVSAATRYVRIIRHIVNETGVQNASEISVSFTPAYQHVVFHTVSIIRNGRSVKQMGPADVKVVQEETDAEDFIYNGTKRAFIILKDVRKEDRIEFAYSIVGFNPVFNGNYSDELYLGSSLQVTNYFRTLITPATLQLQWQAFNEAEMPVRQLRGTDSVFSWTNPAVVPDTDLKNVPDWFSLDKYITVSAFPTWEKVAQWGVSLFNNYQLPLSADLRRTIRDWHLAAGGNPLTYINLATRFVQDQVRYLGIETGIYSHKPHDPGIIYAQRFGDCKDKALLLAMLLRAEGIPAYMALANTSSGTQLISMTPSPTRFNHAIVAVEYDGSYKFIDATIAYQRGKDTAIYTPAYGYALVLRPETKSLTPINSGIRRATLHETFYIANMHEGDSHLEVTSVYEGGMADENRRDFANYSLKDQEDSYQKFYNKYFTGIQTDSTLTYLDDSVNNAFTVHEHYRIPAIWNVDKDTAKHKMNFYAYHFYSYLPDPKSSYAPGPLKLPYPLDIHFTIELVMPDDSWAIPADEEHVHNPDFIFDFTLEKKGNIIRLIYNFITLKDQIDPDEIKRYTDDYARISRVLEYTFSKKSGGGASTGFQMNFITLGFAVLLFGAIYFGFRRLNVLEGKYNMDGSAPLRIKGWVLILGITLLLRFALSLYGLITDNIFDKRVWDLMGNAGGAKLQFVLLAEETNFIILAGGLLLLLFWFFKRRDIFPMMFVNIFIINFLQQLAINVVYSTVRFPDSFGDMTANSVSNLVRVAVYGAVWISFLLRSENVKRTFVLPYKAKAVDKDSDAAETSEMLSNYD